MERGKKAKLWSFLMMMSSGLFSFSDSQVSGLLQVSWSGQKKVGVGLMPVSRNIVECARLLILLYGGG